MPLCGYALLLVLVLEFQLTAARAAADDRIFGNQRPLARTDGAFPRFWTARRIATGAYEGDVDTSAM